MDQKQAIADRLKQANNILVTVSSNPSVDQLASCIGLTLALNKMGKHATAVFSGNIPNTIEFLQPEQTLEKDTNSLRDFIIALDKSKADKLRYKVEDKVVKIFITPYKTSISEKDLEFSQGDFNVDVILALGVHEQSELDQAITAHGRILHDAVVTTVNIKAGGEIGSINWVDTGASSLSELAVELVDTIDKNLVDSQMATALLTGIVAETNRFSNEKTFPTTMTIAAELMSHGANQQLVATKLEPAPAPPAAQPLAMQQPGPAPTDGSTPPAPGTEPPKAEDGSLEIAHEGQLEAVPKTEDAGEPEPEKPEEPPMPQIHIDEHGSLQNMEELKDMPPPPALPEAKGSTDPTEHMGSARMILQPPSLAGADNLNSGAMAESMEAPSGSPMPSPQSQAEHDLPIPPASAVTAMPMPSSTYPSSLAPPNVAATLQPPPFGPAPLPAPAPPAPPMPVAPAMPPTTPLPAPTPMTSTPPSTQTLAEIEQTVHSRHLQPAPEGLPPASAAVFAPAVPSAPVPGAPLPPAPMPDLTPLPPPPAPTLPAPQPAPMPLPPPPPAPAPTPLPPPPPPQPVQQPLVKGGGPETAMPSVDDARAAVMEAIASQPQIEPIQALNAQPLGGPLHEDPAAAPPPPSPLPPPPAPGTLDPAVGMPVVAQPQSDIGISGNGSFTPAVIKPTGPMSPDGGSMPPPPVPPPMVPQQ